MKSSLLKEIVEELLNVFKGKTVDAILPPLFFVILNHFVSLNVAMLSSLALATYYLVFRLVRKHSFVYALSGWIGVALAAGLALLADNATNFFLPGIVSNVFLVIVTLMSLLVGRPLAALASHLTRGWTLSWFYRNDIKPAYTEVTWMWFVLFVIRSGIQILLFIQGDVDQLGWTNLVLGLPFTAFILILSYVYGLWRLKQLQGPGIDEYNLQKQPPYRGQTRGF